MARTAVALAPEEPRAHEVLGDAAVAAHEWLEADRAYRAALRLDPDNEDVAAKVARLARRRPERPERPVARRRPARVPARPRFGRAQRVALYLAVRRAAAWQAVGALVLLIAGLPSPSGLLAWVGLGIAVFVVALAVRGWLGLPAGGRVAPRELSTREPRGGGRRGVARRVRAVAARVDRPVGTGDGAVAGSRCGAGVCGGRDREQFARTVANLRRGALTCRSPGTESGSDASVIGSSPYPAATR